MPKIAVLTFPGNNCEIETRRALRKSGLDAEVFLWNQSPEELKKFDGIVIPGGFSFEDRGRAGVVAAAEPIMDAVRVMAAAGVPVLGICNGAQILVESGLVPGGASGKIKMALARNERKQDGEILGTGYYHDWVYICCGDYLQTTPAKTPFSNFQKILHVPIAHGEGRFLATKEVQQEILKNGQIVFQYCSEQGEIEPEFPVNPNGAFANAAGICNVQGNVLAMMPHPERSADGQVVFDSLKQFFEQGKIKMGESRQCFASTKNEVSFVSTMPSYDLEFYVTLKITDNAEKTLERVAQKKWGEHVQLTRRIFWGVQTKSSQNLKELAQELITSGELLNENKESVIVKIGTEFWEYDKGNGIQRVDMFDRTNTFVVHENTDVVGQATLQKIQHHLGEEKVGALSYGILWEARGEDIQKLQHETLFANPYSEYTVRL